MGLKDYYRVKTNLQLFQCVCEDILVSVFLRSGSGLFTSVIKGLVSHVFIKSRFPILIGKRFRVRHPSNITLGHHVWIKDDVSMLADAKLLIGNNCIIGEKSILTSYGPGLIIGDNVVLGKDCYIAQNGGSITIGNKVLIADNVRMYSLNHKYNAKKIPIMDQGCENTNIVIKNNVWIGSGVVIFNNTTVGSGVIIGANSVVRKDIPDNVVFAGNPGKIIKKIK